MYDVHFEYGIFYHYAELYLFKFLHHDKLFLSILKSVVYEILNKYLGKY